MARAPVLLDLQLSAILLAENNEDLKDFSFEFSARGHRESLTATIEQVWSMITGSPKRMPHFYQVMEQKFKCKFYLEA